MVLPRELAGRLLALALLLLLPATARPFEVAVPGGRVRLAQRGAQTVISGAVSGRRFSLALAEDAGVFAGSLDGVELVGGLPGRVLILSIDYLSRPGAPEGYCGSGVETILRVVALRPRPHETFRQLVASCFRNIDPGQIVWDEGAANLTVERQVQLEPSGHTRSSYHISAEGAITPGKIEILP